MKKSILLLFVVFSTIGTINAQKNSTASSDGGAGYTTGIGLRFGMEGGITFKHFMKPGRAIEGILSSAWGYSGIRLTGLYEIQKGISDVEGLSWFFGFGAHIGTYAGNYYGYYGNYNGGYYDKHGNWHHDGYRTRYPVLGVDGIIGMEYKFEDVPFTAALDFKPYVDFLNSNGRYWDLALSLRYTIK